MILEEEKISGKRHVLVGIGFDGHAKELLDWAIVKVSQPGDSVAAAHVCRNSDSTSKAQVLMDGHLADYQGICNQKKVGLSVEVVKGSSIRKLLVREAKNRASAVVIVGINKNSPLGYSGKVSIAKYCAKKLPSSTEVMAVYNGKVVYSNGSQNTRPSLDVQSEFGDSEVSKDEVLSGSFLRGAGRSLSSISLPVEDFTQQKPGWPLLQTSSEMTQMSKAARKMSVVQWVMTLPNRSQMLEYPQMKSNFSNDFESLVLRLRSNKCKLFSYEILKASTCQFSSDNLIGKGGNNNVYKGVLPDGKHVAIKILKSPSKDSWKWKEFALEVDIMTAIKHKNITRLLGICVAEDSLISVHDLLPRGNLEENLHGNNDRDLGCSFLPWEVRFKIAIGIAEALNYLHNECVQPVIHRDVKSSNILLSDEFNPQLSDFGLSIWGPTEAASFITDSDLVGTFGYLAPEYFMYGKVSDKVDVYSFGVVLLELLSGRRAIGSEASKGEESLVIWAKPKLDSGDFKGILDQNLGKNVDEAEMQRMAFAAKKCLTQAARLRPHMGQVLKILNGDGEELSGESDQLEGECDDEEVYPDSSAAESSHLSIALRDVYENSGSFSSQDQSSPLSVEEYLRRRWSRSSSLD